MLWAFLNLNFKSVKILYYSALKTIPTINAKNEVHLEHKIEVGIDFCNYCNIWLNGHNSVIFNFCSDDYDHTITYCKPCGLILTRDMNIKTGLANGISVCKMCGIPNPCKCNAKKIDYDIRKKLK